MLVMNITEFNQILCHYSFCKTGDITLVDGNPRFANTEFTNECGWVYLWVKKRGEEFFIVYVGKAGRTLRERCEQHKNGFINSVTGKGHAERFRKGFKNGNEYELYGRKSDIETILGEQNIPMECVEEIVFIQKFRELNQPLWNTNIH